MLFQSRVKDWKLLNFMVQCKYVTQYMYNNVMNMYKVILLYRLLNFLCSYFSFFGHTAYPGMSKDRVRIRFN